MTLILKLMLVIGTCAITSLSGDHGECDPLQYLSFDKTDIIQCSFSDFYGVYWYNSTDSSNNYPLVVFEDSKKSGDGYLSGEYDVYLNGSLIIKTVSLKDEHSFRVILLQDKRGISISFDIRVYVVDIDTGEYGECAPLQYLFFDKTDIVHCSFSHFYGVYWYNSTESANNYPLVVLEDSKKSGDGYLSGQYDIYPNGSLIINNVSLKDDHPFRVILLQDKRGSGIDFDIRVYVVVKSNQPHPFIDICGNESFCFTHPYEQLELGCVVSETRPPANLTWIARNASGDWTIPFDSYVSPHGSLYTTEIQTVANFQTSEPTMLLVCLAVSPPDVVPVHEASVLIESPRTDYPVNDSLTINIEIGKQLTLTCGADAQGFLTWKRQKSNGSWETIADVYFGKSIYWKIYEDGYNLAQNGSLIVNEIDIDNEGNYVCVHSVGRVENVESFEVIVFVSPEPPFVIIQGCEPYDRCVLNVSNEGTLTCSLRGIRPQASLQWLPYPEESSKSITFEDCKEVIVKTGDTFDISLTSLFVRKDGTKTTLAVECRVFGWDYEVIDMDRKVELQFTSGEQVQKDADLFIGLGIGGAVGVLIGLLVGFFPLTRKNFRQRLQGWSRPPEEPVETVYQMQNSTFSNNHDEQMEDNRPDKDVYMDGYFSLETANNGDIRRESFT